MAMQTLVYRDSFSSKQFMFVIAGFGVITIISYINELSKAGLLFGPPRYRVAHRLSNVQSVRELFKVPQHQRHINIAMHLGKNESYRSINNTTVYEHNNTLHNFFLVLNASSHLASHGHQQATLASLRQRYQKATRVLIYQHEWAGYGARDCLRVLSVRHGMTLPQSPLTLSQDWDRLLARHHYNVLYGGLCFGVCEKLDTTCHYMTMVSHPIDRLLHVYNGCQQDGSQPFCRFDRLNITQLTLRQFIRSQGNGLFKKLLYHSRHCKLVGDDELCLQDTVFTFDSTERRTHLNHMLDNLHRWFSVVTLASRYEQSMELLQYVFEQNFTECSAPVPLLSDLHSKQRDKLLNDLQVKKWLHADLALYDRLAEIYEQQVLVYRQYQTDPALMKYERNREHAWTENVESRVDHSIIALTESRGRTGSVPRLKKLDATRLSTYRKSSRKVHVKDKRLNRPFSVGSKPQNRPSKVPSSGKPQNRPSKVPSSGKPRNRTSKIHLNGKLQSRPSKIPSSGKPRKSPLNSKPQNRPSKSI